MYLSTFGSFTKLRKKAASLMQVVTYPQDGAEPRVVVFGCGSAARRAIRFHTLSP